jgi:hypothetical protein
LGIILIEKVCLNLKNAAACTPRPDMRGYRERDIPSSSRDNASSESAAIKGT